MPKVIAALLALRFSGLFLQSDVLSESAAEWFLNFPLFGNLFVLLISLVPGHYRWGQVKGLASAGL